MSITARLCFFIQLDVAGYRNSQMKLNSHAHGTYITKFTPITSSTYLLNKATPMNTAVVEIFIHTLVNIWLLFCFGSSANTFIDVFVYYYYLQFIIFLEIS